jgi:ArsR family transcriptional regulator, arsenate/arsenite/antimonite-responsive transcriptional repressor
MDKLSRAAQALSDETRLRILNLLTAKECCVCEVMQALEISQTRASRNLKILDDAGFLDMRNEGLYTLYSVRETNGDGFYGDLLRAVKSAMESNETSKKDIGRLQQSKRVGPGCTTDLICSAK